MSEADRWLSRSPGFFGGKPVVMDVSALPAEKAVITALMDDLATRQIRIMGILGADESLAGPDLPPFFRRPAAHGGKPTARRRSRTRSRWNWDRLP